MIYLASPYSHPDPVNRKTRFLLARERTAELLQDRLWVYSPIVHCHDVAETFKMAMDFEFWKEYNFNMLRRMDVVEVLAISGWDESKGVRAEIQFALDAGIPVTYHRPGNVRGELG